MSEHLICMDCGASHKARSDKFPFAYQGRDQETGEKKIMGYICKKDAIKRHKRKQLKIVGV